MRSDYPGYLIDTNVLLYVHDPSDKAKQERAITLLETLTRQRSGFLSVQVMAEFSSVALSKFRDYLSLDDAIEQVTDMQDVFTVLDLTPVVVLEALRGVRDHQLSYWDAQIWATALLNQIPTVLSEDFSNGSNLEGVAFVDPFNPAFDVARLSRL